ncbi:hypothetical protein [Cyanobium sp. ULC065]
MRSIGIVLPQSVAVLSRWIGATHAPSKDSRLARNSCLLYQTISALNQDLVAELEDGLCLAENPEGVFSLSSMGMTSGFASLRIL